MFPTISDSGINDNAPFKSNEAIVRRIANDQANVARSYEKTLSRMMSRHNAHENKKLYSWENDNSRESFVRPKPDVAGASNRTLDKIIANHGRDDDSVVSWENDNTKDFYETFKRNPTEEDHNETLNRIMAKQSKQQDAEYVMGPDKGSELLPSLGSKNEAEYLKSIDNTTTNILDVLHGMFKMLEDFSENTSVASQKAREMDHEAGNKSSHMDPEALSEALQRALKGNRDQDKEDTLKDQLTKITKAFGAGAAAIVAGGFVGAMGSLLPHNEKAETGGHSGHQQAPGHKSSDPRRSTGVVPHETPAPAAPEAQIEPVGRVRKPRGKKAQLQVGLFNAFKRQGYTDEGAKTMVAEVGRENSFNEKLIFGSHIDPHNKVQNSGMISWQGRRSRKLMEFLRKRGLLDKNGHMIHSQATIDAQAEFLDLEMRSDPSMRHARAMLMDPSKRYSDIEAEVGRKVIAWRHDDPRYSRAGHRAQEKALAEMNALIRDQQGRGANLNQQSAQNTAKGNTVVVVNNNQKTVNNAQTHKPAGKPPMPSARSHFWDGWSKYFGL